MKRKLDDANRIQPIFPPRNVAPKKKFTQYSMPLYELLVIVKTGLKINKHDYNILQKEKVLSFD